MTTLVLLLAVAPPAHAKRKIVPVPLWSAFDGARWGDLRLGETTREAFVRDYASSEANLPGAMEGNTANKTNTQVFVLFDGPGSSAKLATVVVFYDGERSVPTLAEWEDRYGRDAITAFPKERLIDWRLRLAAGQGTAALVERGETGERIAALIFARPERLKQIAVSLSPTATDVGPLLAPKDREPLIASVAYVDVNVDLDRNVAADRRSLRRDIERAAENELRSRSYLRLAARDGGRLAVDLEGDLRRQQNRLQLRLRARASLDADSPYGRLTASSGDQTRDLEGGASESRVEREARRLCEQAVAAAAGSINGELQQRRSQALTAARRRARLGLATALGSGEGK